MAAAAASQLEVLQWVRDNDADGQVWAESTVRICAGGPRNQEVLTWLDQLSLWSVKEPPSNMCAQFGRQYKTQRSDEH